MSRVMSLKHLDRNSGLAQPRNKPHCLLINHIVLANDDSATDLISLPLD